MSRIKYIYGCVLFVFLFVACDKQEDEGEYRTPFHFYAWAVDSLPVIAPPAGLDESFVLVDSAGKRGGIAGVVAVRAIAQQDTVVITNMVLKDGVNAILSDTIRRDWFAIINERESLSVLLNRHEGEGERKLEIQIIPTHAEYAGDGHAACGSLHLTQHPQRED